MVFLFLVSCLHSLCDGERLRGQSKEREREMKFGLTGKSKNLCHVISIISFL